MPELPGDDVAAPSLHRAQAARMEARMADSPCVPIPAIDLWRNAAEELGL